MIKAWSDRALDTYRLNLSANRPAVPEAAARVADYYRQRGQSGPVLEHQTATVLVEAVIPTRGLIGFESDLVNLTRGLGSMSHLFKEYGPPKGEISSRDNGVLVAMEGGISTAYALNNVQERGKLFIGPQEDVYEGMIVGENSRPDDLNVNPCKAKHLTNMRSQGDGKGVQLAPPVRMSLERVLEYIARDEYVEATPKALRLRKKILESTARKRSFTKVS